MIRVIDSTNKSNYSQLIDQMFQQRARVFNDILQWDVVVEYGREFDIFDDADPIYIVSLNEETNTLNGSVRLLPTTGPNMLQDVFGELLEEGANIVSPLIWESSRFSINPDLSRNSNRLLNDVTVELLCGMIEVGLRAKISHIVSVYDKRMTRIFRRANCNAEIIGGPKRIGKVPTFAGLFDITRERWEAVAATGNVFESVLCIEERRSHTSTFGSDFNAVNIPRKTNAVPNPDHTQLT